MYLYTCVKLFVRTTNYSAIKVM